ncbi:MAG: tetratricopeptide repeat protein, partial [Desulfobacterales bacterium]|nr:tetratricopeptide repeat protein [Desulfobacterales bacterium]
MSSQILSRSRNSEREFIVLKTDTKPKEKSSIVSTSDVFKIIGTVFPNTLLGEKFAKNAIIKIQSSKFCAMSIKIDEFKPFSEGITEEDVSIVIGAAKAINNICKNKKGVWGPLSFNIFGCFFPEKETEECLEIAQNIQDDIKKQTNKTVSIGIAPFPIIDFKKEDILYNAFQAIEHAAFLGQGSTVCFDAITLNINGDKLYQEGNIDDAIIQFKRAITLDPSNVNVHNSLGVCYAVKKNYKNAMEEFESAIKFNPLEVMALYNLGLAKLLSQNKELALDLFLQADAIDNNMFEVKFQLGKIYLEDKEYEKSKLYLEKALEINQDSVPALHLLGECYTSLNMLKEAVNIYKKAIKYNPSDAHSLSSLGYVFDLLGENPEISILFCKQSVEIQPENELFRERLKKLYFK